MGGEDGRVYGAARRKTNVHARSSCGVVIRGQSLAIVDGRRRPKEQVTDSGRLADVLKVHEVDEECGRGVL